MGAEPCAFTLGGLRQVCGAGPPTLLLRRCRVHGIHDAEQKVCERRSIAPSTWTRVPSGRSKSFFARSGGPAM